MTFRNLPLMCLLSLAGCTLSSCASSGAAQEQQQAMLAKLAAMEERVQTLEAAQSQAAAQCTAQVAALKEQHEALAAAVKPKSPKPQPSQPKADRVHPVPLGTSYARGPQHAWVTVVFSADFQCPFSKRAKPTVEQIQQHYGDDVRVVFKHNPLPFHARALPAALAAECAGAQNRFWEMYDLLFENQRALEDAQLLSYAAKLELHMASFERCYRDRRYGARITEDQAEMAREGASGTPAFFINGRRSMGARPFDTYAAIIDEELAKARASGTAKETYYETHVLGGPAAGR